MALRTFTENVINLVIENCLLTDLPKILTPRKVDRMSEDTLKELALESEEVRTEREILQKETKLLRDGLRKCQRNRPRERTGRLDSI